MSASTSTIASGTGWSSASKLLPDLVCLVFAAGAFVCATSFVDKLGGFLIGLAAWGGSRGIWQLATVVRVNRKAGRLVFNCRQPPGTDLFVFGPLVAAMAAMLMFYAMTARWFSVAITLGFGGYFFATRWLRRRQLHANGLVIGEDFTPWDQVDTATRERFVASLPHLTSVERRVIRQLIDERRGPSAADAAVEE